MRTILFSLAVICSCLFACERLEPQGMEFYGSSQCGSCVATACAAEMRSCGADSSCTRYLWCLGDCPVNEKGDAEASCEARCMQGVLTGSQSLARAVTQCRVQGAGANCQTCGRNGTPAKEDTLFNQQCAPPMASSKCGSCLEERCCESRKTCLAGECSPLIDCVSDSLCSGSADCVAKCRRDHSSGLVDFERYILCAEVRCPAECGQRPDACQICKASFCSELLIRSRTDPNCINRGYCFNGCVSGDTACRQVCNEQESRCISEVLFPLTLCGLNNCPFECR